ncbi:MAG: hypothetical protein RL754_1318 [Bacteroidota bacterium]|jgi:uncharacterized protein involved in exopolysaccharide biosynthesis
MEYSSANLVAFFYKNWKSLIIIPFVAMVLAVVFTAPTFIKPLFESQVILFPSTTNSVSKALLPQQNGYGDEDILEFGDEQQAEQLLQILNSGEIRDSVIGKFDLMNHYEIDEATKYRRTKLFKEYESKIEFNRTQFMSVEINVLDTDPQIAADIANYIAYLVDKVKRRVQKSRAQMGLEIVGNEYHNLQAEIQKMEDKITELRYKGVHDYESQSAVFNEQYAIALAEGASSERIKALERRLDTLAKYGGKYVSIRDELQLLKEEEVKLKTKFDQAKVDVNQVLPATFKVDAAFPAERKTYPKRSVLILAVGFATFVFMAFYLLVRNSILEFRASMKD